MKLGTTVTAMLFAGRRYFLWHSGDTRAYRVVTEIVTLIIDLNNKI